ncbi:MAG TPA: nucleotidyltransferase domain-containing protein [Microbacterium sp.]|nr:nucleotidyltransferase domain-containing protein [Microbacterium sp.]
MELLRLAERFVAARFPSVDIAVVGGSTSRGTRTATSDIDLLLIGDHAVTDGRTSLAATYAFEGEPIEVFAYTPAAFEEWAQSGLAQFRPVILDLLLEGTPLRDTPALRDLRIHWRPIFDAGPSAEQHELDLRRYAVTDLIDDLRDAADDLERAVIAFTLFKRLAELLLISNGCWIGTGKHLPRRLREWDAERTEALAQPLLARDFDAFAGQAARELELLGGRLQTGFVR